MSSYPSAKILQDYVRDMLVNNLTEMRTKRCYFDKVRKSFANCEIGEVFTTQEIISKYILILG